MTTPVLTILDQSGDFVIYSNAFGQGLGCMLMQHDRVVAYASRQLKCRMSRIIWLIAQSWLLLYLPWRFGDITYSEKGWRCMGTTKV